MEDRKVARIPDKVYKIAGQHPVQRLNKDAGDQKQIQSNAQQLMQTLWC